MAAAEGDERGRAGGERLRRAERREAAKASRPNASEYAAATTSKGSGGSAFERAGGLLYVRNFFEPETYERAGEECSVTSDRGKQSVSALTD